MAQLIAKLIFVTVAFTATMVVARLLARLYRLLTSHHTHGPPAEDIADNREQITVRHQE